MTTVRCCCEPSNLVGHVPMHEGAKAGLILRELEDGEMAFESREGVESIPGFVRENKKGGKKTWRKK